MTPEPRTIDVVTEAFADDLAVTDLTGGGYVPTQIQGAVDGYPFYYRARHGTVTIQLSDPETGAEVWCAEIAVPTEFGAGHLSPATVAATLKAFVALYRDLHDDAGPHLARIAARRDARIERQVAGLIVAAMGTGGHWKPEVARAVAALRELDWTGFDPTSLDDLADVAAAVVGDTSPNFTDVLPPSAD